MATSRSGSSEHSVGSSESRPRTGILFVDDDPNISQLVSESSAEEPEYSFAVFTDPAAALEEFRDDPELYSVLITDESMPGMSGEELARACLEFNDALTIVVCSGLPGTRKRLQHLSPITVLSKPYGWNDLMLTIRRAGDTQTRRDP